MRLLILQHLLKRLDEKRVYKVSAAPSRKKQEQRLPPVVSCLSFIMQRGERKCQKLHRQSSGSSCAAYRYRLTLAVTAPNKTLRKTGEAFVALPGGFKYVMSSETAAPSTFTPESRASFSSVAALSPKISRQRK